MPPPTISSPQFGGAYHICVVIPCIAGPVAVMYSVAIPAPAGVAVMYVTTTFDHVTQHE